MKSINTLRITFTKNSLLRSFSTNEKRTLEGKRAVITGSTSGIGLGIARELASQGCSIMFNGFGNPSEINQLKSDFAKQYKIKAEYHSADMSKPNEIESLIDTTISKLGGIDILVNNAGIQHVAPVEQFPVERWDSIIAINLSAVFHTTRKSIPFMKSQKWGRIINISSVHGLVASVNKSAYVAAKHGVVGFNKTIALECAGTGITSNCINPGWVHTPLVQKQIESKAQEKGMSIKDATELLLSEKQPSKQFVTVNQLGQLTTFLCSDAASQITGISIPVDGGWTSQ